MELDHQILLAVGIPAAGVAIGLIRYFWKKEKCFVIMQETINQLTKNDGDSSETHNDFDYRLTEIEKRQQKNEIYLKLLLDHAKIKYEK